MILAAASVLLAIGVLVFTLAVRQKDLPPPEPVSPTKYLEERKATIFEGLRDLQFEYRLGKLSDADYQQTKLDLQKELAKTMAEIDAVNAAVPAAAPASQSQPVAVAASNQCPHCGAKFAKPMKFCGECGKAMTGEPR
jgi:hypothetical protein